MKKSMVHQECQYAASLVMNPSPIKSSDTKCQPLVVRMSPDICLLGRVNTGHLLGLTALGIDWTLMMSQHNSRFQMELPSCVS